MEPFKDIKIGKNVEIGKDVTIFPNVFIGDNTQIGEGTIVQYGAYIEHNCKIGKFSRVGTNTVLRRETNIGDHSIFGSLSASEGKNWIGNNVLIHSQCHLTTGLIVEDWVFIAPFFVGANDPDMVHGRRNIKSFIPQAAHIKFGSRIAVGVTVNPGVVIGREVIIGSSSLVTRSIPDFSIAFGIPAKVKSEVKEEFRLSEESYYKFRERISKEELEELIAKMIKDV